MLLAVRARIELFGHAALSVKLPHLIGATFALERDRMRPGLKWRPLRILLALTALARLVVTIVFIHRI